MSAQQSGGNTTLQFRINDTYTGDEYKARIKECLEGKHQDSLPFPHFAFTNFVKDSALIADLRKELQAVAWVKKCNDLYSMSQTVDLADLQANNYPALSSFRQFMMTEVRQWLTMATGIQLGDKLSLTASRYCSSDCLLPHDDRLEGRAFAFVLYLTIDWIQTDGGELCLFDSDPVKNYPTKVSKRIQPIENTLSLFRVQHNSWHSVEEVLTEKQRLSLNGWFHYPENAIIPLGPGPAAEEPYARIKPTMDMDISLEDVNAWLNPNYVKPEQHKQIKRIFAYKSELSLQQFLNVNRYNEALAELEAAEFANIGPPNKRNVWKLNEEKLAKGSILRSLFRLLRSEAITLLLTQWTGLHLYDLKKKTTGIVEKKSPASKTGQETKEYEKEQPPEKKARTSEEAPQAKEIGTSDEKKSSIKEDQQKNVEIVSHIYRFDKGSYSMADDQMAADSENNGFCLDLMLFFGNRPEWPSQFGGFTSFFAIGEDEEIMRVNPTMNTAAIVFREPEVLNFTKYVNHKAAADHFFVLNCSFFGVSSGESESESSLESEEEESPEEEFDEEELPEEDEGSGQQKPKDSEASTLTLDEQK